MVNLDLIRKLRSRTFRFSDINISPVFHIYIQRNNLHVTKHIAGYRMKYNITEIVWMHIVRELFEFKIDIDIVRIIRDNIFRDIDDFKLTGSADDIEKFKRDIKEFLHNDFSDEYFNFNAEYDDYLYKQTKKISISILENSILESYFLKCQNKIFIRKNGDIVLQNNGQNFNLKQNDIFNSANVIDFSLNINSLLAKIFIDYTVAELEEEWKIINRQEAKILTLIKNNKDLKSVKIKFSNDSKISQVEVLEDIKVKKSDKLSALIISGGYHDIKVITDNGNVIHCERKTKYRI